MSLRDIINGDVDIFFDADGFAEEAEYNGVTILVLPELGEGNSKSKPFDGEKTYEDAVFSVKRTDVPNPGIGDTVLYNNVEYQYVSTVEAGRSRTRIRCIANESAVVLGRL